MEDPFLMVLIALQSENVRLHVYFMQASPTYFHYVTNNLGIKRTLMKKFAFFRCGGPLLTLFRTKKQSYEIWYSPHLTRIRLGRKRFRWSEYTLWHYPRVSNYMTLERYRLQYSKCKRLVRYWKGEDNKLFKTVWKRDNLPWKMRSIFSPPFTYSNTCEADERELEAKIKTISDVLDMGKEYEAIEAFTPPFK